MTALAAPVLREVRLYGRLGREFGRVFHLAITTPAEAARALCAVMPGFRRAFFGDDGRAAYHVFVGRGAGRRDIGEADKEAVVGASEPIRIVPVVQGAKRGGVLQTVLGVVLIAVGAYFGYTPLVQLGASMLLGGVIQLLSPQRSKSATSADNLPSYAFDGVVNNTEQGGPVPVVFGRVICGSTVVSQGLSTTQLITPGAYGTGNANQPTNPALPAWETRGIDEP